MSAIGTKRTLAEGGFVRSERPLYPRKRTLEMFLANVRFRPKADVQDIQIQRDNT